MCARPTRSGRPRSNRLRRSARLLTLMAFLAYAYAIPRGLLPNADSHIALTRAIVDGHTLRIDAYAGGLADRSAYHGHFYTDKAPGLSLLSVPAYALLRLVLPSSFFSPALFFVARYLLTAIVVSLPAALFVGALWRFLLPVLGRGRAALLASGYAFGTMAWTLSALLFSHLVAAMSLFGAFMLLYPLSVHACPRLKRSVWRFTLAGGLCGLAVSCEYPSVLVAGLLALFAARVVWTRREETRRPWRALVLFGLAALALMAPLALYNQAVYGSPLSQGYAHLHGGAQFIVGMRQGVEGVGLPRLAALWGITFSPYRGLFVLSPFLLLVAPGVLAMWRRRRQRAAAVLCAASIAAMLLFNAGYYFWDGGASLGPRHLGPALPFLVFPIAFALRRRRWRRVGRLLILLSIAIVAASCLAVLIFPQGQANPFIGSVLPRLLRGPAENNWGLLLGLRGWASLVPLVAIEGGLVVALRRSLRGAGYEVRAASDTTPSPSRTSRIAPYTS